MSADRPPDPDAPAGRGRPRATGWPWPACSRWSSAAAAPSRGGGAPWPTGPAALHRGAHRGARGGQVDPDRPTHHRRPVPAAGRPRPTGGDPEPIDQVAVLAVDPSSPFSGGAILGDRVRMQDARHRPHASSSAPWPPGATWAAWPWPCPRPCGCSGRPAFPLVIVETVGVGPDGGRGGLGRRHHRGGGDPGLGRLDAGQQGRASWRWPTSSSSTRPTGPAAARPGGTSSRCSTCRSPATGGRRWSRPWPPTGEGVAELWAEVARHRGAPGGARGRWGSAGRLGWPTELRRVLAARRPSPSTSWRRARSSPRGGGPGGGARPLRGGRPPHGPMSRPRFRCRRGDGPFDPSARWFQHAVFYEVLIRGFFDANDDGTGDLKGLRAEARLHRVAGHRLHLGAPVLPVALPRQRLRHQRLLQRAPRLRDARRPGGLPGGCPRPGHPGHRRPGHEPHQRPAPLVHRVALEPRQPQGRLVRLERRRPTLARGPGGLHRVRNGPTGRGTTPGSSTTGTASTPISRTSTTKTPRSPTP